MALAIIWGGAILGTKRPQPFDGRGKLAERIEVEFRPFALLLHRVEPNAFWSLCPPFWVHLRQRFATLEPSPTGAAAYPGANSPAHRIADGGGGPQLLQHVVELALDLVQAAQDQ